MEKLVKKFVNPCNDFGIKHNEILRQAFDHISEEKNLEKAVIKATRFIEDYFDMRVRQEISESTTKLADDLFVEMEETDKISPQLLHAYKELYDQITTSMDLAEVTSRINLMEYEADRIFKGDELELYYMALAIAKYSAKFWSPKEMGGEDGFKYRISVERRMGYPVSESKNFDFIGYAQADALGFMFGTPFGVPFCSSVYSSLMEGLK